MARKRYTTEQIIGLLREAEVQLPEEHTKRKRLRRRARLVKSCAQRFTLVIRPTCRTPDQSLVSTHSAPFAEPAAGALNACLKMRRFQAQPASPGALAFPR